MAKLRIVSGDGTEQVVDVRGSQVHIGRGRDNDIVLPDPEKGVSRAHAELRLENDRYVLVDLRSQNGTWLNGRRIEKTQVPFGAEIAVGAYRLTLLSEATAIPVAPPRRLRVDPLDDMRATKRHDPAAFAPRRAAAKPSAAVPRWTIGVAAAVVILVALAAMAWTSGARTGSPNSSSDVPAGSGDGTAAPLVGASSTPTSTTPAGPPSTERAADVPELPAASPVKRSAERAPVGAGSVGSTRIQRRPGESADAWRSRGAALQMRYGYSKAALDRGDFAAAAGGFQAILMEEPGFLDAPGLLVQAQSGLRASARRLFEAGRGLDAAGDWVGALQKYEQARQIYADVQGLTEGLQRVRGQLRIAGTNAFKHARQLETSGQPQEALKEYEKAIQWLSPDDPNRQVARARVEQLRRND